MKKTIVAFLLMGLSAFSGTNSSATARVTAVVTNREPKLSVVQSIEGRTVTGKNVKALRKAITGNVNLLVEAYEDTTGTGEADMRIVYPVTTELKNVNKNENSSDKGVLTLGDVQGAKSSEVRGNYMTSIIRTKVDKETSWLLPYSMEYHGQTGGVFSASIPIVLNYN